MRSRVLALFVSTLLLQTIGAAYPDDGANAASCSWAPFLQQDRLAYESLTDIDGSGQNLWAVGGGSDGSEFSTFQAVAKHWDGATWTDIATPVGTQSERTFSGIAVIDAATALAVGSKRRYKAVHHPPFHAPRPSHPLLERWDGTTWSVIRTAELEGEGGFEDIDVIAADDVWAVGSRVGRGGHSRSLIEHFDGTTWKVIPDPVLPRREAALSAVSAAAPADIWVVGKQTLGHAIKPLIEHWNGSAWSTVSAELPTSDDLFQVLNDVDAIASGDAWAVGYRENGDGSTTVAEHWDGLEWHLVASVDPAEGGIGNMNAFAAVSDVSPTAVWAAGSFNASNPGSYQPTHPLFEVSSGEAFSQEPAQSPSTSAGISGVIAVAPDDGWAVGAQDEEPHSSFLPGDSLIERWSCGS